MSKYLSPRNYLRFLSIKLLQLTSPLIKLWENKKIEKYASTPIKHQPIFIIGAPRTGSTILYQSITNQYDVLYIDNLVCAFNKNLYAGFFLSNLLFKNKSHDRFESRHGTTDGLHSPSECGAFWYRWLPTDKHFIDYSDFDESIVNAIRSEITAVTNKYNKPLIFKNLNAGQRLRLLHRCFPDAKFIFCKRDPFYTAQSILLAKRRTGISDNEFWSVMPRNVENLKPLSWPEQIVAQIYYLEKQIIEDLSLFPEKNKLDIEYLELSTKTLSILAGQLQLVERNFFQPARINLNEKISITEEEANQINTQVLHYFGTRSD